MQLHNPQAQADHRSAEILGRVRQAFVEKGFDGASMQDLARAAGMSVGNFYRYFPSKDAIIHGLIEADLADIRRDFDTIIETDHPMATLRQVMRDRLFSPEPHANSELWTEIEAAARRSPDIGQAALRMEAEVTARLLAVFAKETGLDADAAATRLATPAAFILVLFKAASCLNCAHNRNQDELKSMILRTIEQTLDDVTNNARKA